MHTPITCLVGTYNEAQRLPAFLRHAERWADEVLVADKCSTDGTPELALERGACVVQVPFSRAGFEDPAQALKHAANDWVFCMTPGEIPTRGLIEAVRRVLEQREAELDLVYIPKRLYSFGVHDADSPWSVSYQPFLLHRKRAVISATVHRNFAPRSPERATSIEFSETCHVLHPTHATVEKFIASHVDYIAAEAAGCSDPQAKLIESLGMIRNFRFGGPKRELLGQALAWQFYWTGVALAAWEKGAGRDVPALYRELTAAALAEWGG